MMLNKLNIVFILIVVSVIFYYRWFFSKRSCRSCLPAGAQCSRVFPSSPLSCSELYPGIRTLTAAFLHITPVWDPQSIHAFLPRGTCLWTAWFHLKCLREVNVGVLNTVSSLLSYLDILIKSYPVLILIPRFLVRAHTRSSAANISLALSAGRSRDGWWCVNEKWDAMEGKRST